MGRGGGRGLRGGGISNENEKIKIPQLVGRAQKSDLHGPVNQDIVILKNESIERECVCVCGCVSEKSKIRRERDDVEEEEEGAGLEGAGQEARNQTKQTTQ